jgi:hypothetical protein
MVIVMGVFLAGLPGCAVRKSTVPAPAAYQGILASETGRLQESLFKGDQEVLSNDDIQKILNAQITLDNRHRLAVLGLNPRSAYSQAISDMELRNSEHFLQH